MLKILQARLQQYVNYEIPDVQAGFRKGRGSRDQIANILWIIKKNKKIPEKHLLLLHWLSQILCCVDHNKLWKILRDGNIRSPYMPPEKPGADQEATVRTRHGKVDWFQTGKGVCQVCMLSPCLFNLYAKHIKRNAGLDERQAGIKIARRIINDLRYADDTTLTAESEEELKSLLMKVKEGNEKAGLKLSIQKN